MARPNKLWFDKQNKSFCVRIKGIRHNLGKDQEAANKEFHRLMSLDEPAPQKKCNLLAAELFDAFLVWVKANKAEETYKWYFKRLQAFLNSLPNQRIEASLRAKRGNSIGSLTCK